MIFANLKNGCKRACNLVKNSRAVRFCILVAVCLTFNVATALAQSGGLLDIHNWDALNVTKSKVTKSRFMKKKNPQPLVWEIADAERLASFCGSDGEWAVAHAARSSEGSQGCREDADDDLNDGLPSFFLHSAFMVFFRG
jgi:hypothetical protein